MGVKLKHASGNGTVIGAPAANPSADITLKAPSTTGSAGQVLKVASANHSSTNAELEWAADAGGKLLKKTYYEIPRGTFSSADFPNDDTVPQIDEATLAFSQAYTPTNTSGCEIWITTHFHLAETSNVSNAIIAALFISDNTSALQVRSAYQEGNDSYHNVNITIIHKMATWSGAKTLSIRVAGVNSINYQHYGGSNWGTAIYGAEPSKSPFIIEEIST